MSNQWQHGLCGCFDNCSVCIITYFVPCYTFGKNAEAVGENCMLCALGFFVPLANLWFGASIRGKIREQKGIEGSLVKDLLTFCCCPFCVITQSAMEVGSIGSGSMAIDREWRAPPSSPACLSEPVWATAANSCGHHYIITQDRLTTILYTFDYSRTISYDCTTLLLPQTLLAAFMPHPTRAADSLLAS